MLALTTHTSVFAITKCQDENGKWHYGDNASDKCARTNKIVKMNQRGVKVGEVAGEKTEVEKDQEQLAKEQAKIEQQKELAAMEEKNRILSIYETESDIDRARENVVTSLEQQKAVHDAYIVSLTRRREASERKMQKIKAEKQKVRIQEQIVQIDKDVEKSRKAKLDLDYKIEEANQRFDQELALFRKHKNDS